MIATAVKHRLFNLFLSVALVCSQSTVYAVEHEERETMSGRTLETAVWLVNSFTTAHSLVTYASLYVNEDPHKMLEVLKAKGIAPEDALPKLELKSGQIRIKGLDPIIFVEQAPTGATYKIGANKWSYDRQLDWSTNVIRLEQILRKTAGNQNSLLDLVWEKAHAADSVKAGAKGKTVNQPKERDPYAKAELAYNIADGPLVGVASSLAVASLYAFACWPCAAIGGVLGVLASYDTSKKTKVTAEAEMAALRTADFQCDDKKNLSLVFKTPPAGQPSSISLSRDNISKILKDAPRSVQKEFQGDVQKTAGEVCKDEEKRLRLNRELGRTFNTHTEQKKTRDGNVNSNGRAD